MLQYPAAAAAAAEPPAADAAADAALPAAAAAAAAPPPATVACIWFKGTTWSPNAPSVIAISTYVENEVVLLSTSTVPEQYFINIFTSNVR